MAAQPLIAPGVPARPLRLAARLAILALLTASAWLSPFEGLAQSSTGAIAGHVQIVARNTKRLHSAGAYPTRAIGTTTSVPHAEISNVVVYVKARPTPTTPARAAVRQVDEEFLPHVVAITAGSTVDFPNDDFVFHNVFSLSRAGTFDLGRFPRGESRSRTFKQPGTVKAYCHLHSHMSAVIRVFDHPYFTIPSANGLFTIEGVPPGSYDVVAWHERVGEVTLRAELGAGRTAQLAFSLPLTDTP